MAAVGASPCEYNPRRALYGAIALRLASQPRIHRDVAVMTASWTDKTRVVVALMYVVFLPCVEAARGQTAPPRAQSRQPNTWSATSTTGLTVGGTWTVMPLADTAMVTGTWTLVGTGGRIAANGVWSAAKTPSGWSGAWRAAAVGRPSEYSGTWRANAKVRADAAFADIFASAVNAAVRGTWRAGGRSGAWSIRAGMAVE
jgi:hypothetical protein